MAFKEFTGALDAPTHEQSAPTGFREFSGQLDPPSTASVAINAIPKVVANFLNTPNTISSLILHGVAAIPGMPQGMSDLANDPRLNRNGPMELMKKLGVVKPENEPRNLLQRLLDTAIQAGVGSALVPAGGIVNTLKTALMGAGSGAIGQGVKEFTSSPVLGAVAGMLSPFALKAGADFLGSAKKVLLNDTGKMTFNDARNLGFVTEPSQVRQPSSKLESIAGKAAIAQGAVEKNQEVANKLAAQAIGLSPDTPLSGELLKALKTQTMQPYEAVDQVFNQMKQQGKLDYFSRYHSPSLKEDYVKASQNERGLWNSYMRDPTVDKRNAAEAASQHTKDVFKDIMNVAEASGNPNLPKQVLQAKQMYAKINDVENSMNVGTGNVSMPTLGRMLDHGRPLSGELKIIGKFANAFPRSAREIERTPPSGFSGTDASSAAVLGTIGSAASGSPYGLAAAGLPLLRGPARSILLSNRYQNNLLRQPRLNLGLNIPNSSALTASGMTAKTLYDKKDEE